MIPPYERLTALMSEPPLVSAPGLRETLAAWTADSAPAGERDGWPVRRFRDPRSGQDVLWGVTCPRPNGLTGWFESPSSRGSWRIDLEGRVHRGLAWMASREVRLRRPSSLLWVMCASEPGSAAYEAAKKEATKLLGIRAP